MKQTSHKSTLTIPSRLEELTKVEALSGRVGKKLGLSEDEQDNLSIAVTEAVGNAIVHGNKKDPKKKVHIQFVIKKDQATISVTDEGKGFKPDELADPLDPKNLLRESGRGIFILKTLMDDVHWDFSESGTTIHFTMKKKSRKE